MDSMTPEELLEPMHGDCGDVLEIADDMGDNLCTFHCQLDRGHGGLHRAATRWDSGEEFAMLWRRGSDRRST